MINKLLLIGLVFLGMLTGFCAVQSCAHSPNYVQFIKPPSESKIWQKNFVVWPRRRAGVRVEGSMWQMMSKDASRAMKAWNQAIGCKVFYPSWEAEAEIVISMAPQPEGENWAGSAKFVPRHSKNGDAYWGSNIFIFNLYLNDQEKRDNIMGHELGHALGLEDLAQGKNMLMYWSLSTGTDVDKEVLVTLNKIYCRGE